MRFDKSSSELKTIARPFLSKSDESAAERLSIAPCGASDPKRATSPPWGSIGSFSGRITW